MDPVDLCMLKTVYEILMDAHHSPCTRSHSTQHPTNLFVHRQMPRVLGYAELEDDEVLSITSHYKN